MLTCDAHFDGLAANRYARMASDHQPDQPAPTYELEIRLQRSRPPVWRRVLVPGDRPPLCLAGKGAGPMQEDGLDLSDLNATLAVLAKQRAR